MDSTSVDKRRHHTVWHERMVAFFEDRHIRLSPLTEGQVGPIFHIKTLQGEWVLKTSDVSDYLPTEGRMLEDLRRAGIRVPEVLAVTDEYLLMEYIPPTERFDEEDAADMLVRLHRVSNDAHMYGYYYDTPIATFWQTNEQTQYNWTLFYTQMRLLPMAIRCFHRRIIDKTTLNTIETLCDGLYRRLDLATIRPSLIHGDIWKGNVLFDGKRTVLIDPALYFADSEAELAFIEMFGTFGKGFWRRYLEQRPLSEAYEELKRPLYQLYPYLVHAALYGETYVPGVLRCLHELQV